MATDVQDLSSEVLGAIGPSWQVYRIGSYMVLKRVAKDSVLFSLANFGSRILGMLLVPLYVQFIDPADYGQLDFLQVLSAILSMILVCGLPSAMIRFYHGVEREQRTPLVSTGLISVVALSMPIAILILILAPQLADLFFQFPNSALYIRILAVTLALTLPTRYLNSFLILRGYSKAFVVTSLGHTALALTLNVVFVAGLRLGVAGLLLASAVSLVPQLLALLWVVRKEVRFAFDKVLLQKLVRFGAPMILASVSGWILSSSDRFFLVHYQDFEQVGLYSIAYKFAAGLNFLLFAPFIRAWTASIFGEQKNADLPAIIRKSARLFVSAALAVGVSASVFIPEVLVLLTNPKYYGAYIAFPFITASLIAFNFNRLLEVPLHLKNRSGLSGSVGLLAMCANLVLNYLLIPRYGIMGAAIATWLSYSLNNVVFYLLVKRINPVPYPILPTLAFFALGIVLVFVCLTPALDLWWLYKGLILLPYLALLAAWNRQDLSLGLEHLRLKLAKR